MGSPMGIVAGPWRPIGALYICMAQGTRFVVTLDPGFPLPQYDSRDASYQLQGSWLGYNALD